MRPRTAALLLAGLLLVASCSNQPVYPPPPLADGSVVIDVASLTPEVPRFFTLMVNGRPVSFFVIRMAAGVQAYLDACVTCYPHRRGYACRDGQVVCRKCDMSFSIYKLEKGMGGCYPVKVEGRTEGGSFLIPLPSLEAHAGKF